MNPDEIVDTSDPDEREVLNAYHPSYWQKFAVHTPAVQVSATSPGSHGRTLFNSTDTQPASSTSGAKANQLRYTLRARNAKQLNPYAYDQLLYTRQMKSNPEAIIKIVSSRENFSRQHGERWHSDDGMSDQRDPQSEKRRWYPKSLDDESSSEGHQHDNKDLRSDAQQLGKRKDVRSPGGRGCFGSSSPILTKQFPFRDRNFPDSESLPGVDSDQLSTNGVESGDVWSDENLPPRTPLSMESQSSALHGSRSASSRSSASGNDSAVVGLEAGSPIRLCQIDRDPLRRSRAVEKGRLMHRLDDTGDDELSRSRSPSPVWDFQGLKELKKVWPAVMVNSYLKQLENAPVTRKPQVYPGDRKQDEPLRPGETRIRHSTRTSPQTRIFKGDSDNSSQGLGNTSADNNLYSDDHREPLIVSPRSPYRRVRRKRRNDAGAIHHDSLESSDGNDPVISLSLQYASAAVISKSDRKVHRARINPDAGGMVGNPVPRNHPLERGIMQWRGIREQGANLHTFTASGQRVASLRRKRLSLKVDLEDEEFHRALAPLAADSIHQSHLSPSKVLSGPSSMGADATVPNLFPTPGNNDQGGDSRLRRKIEVKQDLGILFLPSGITFGADTYLGKGWLHELVTVLSQCSELTAPTAFSASGLTFFPDMLLSDFSCAFTIVCDGLLDLLKTPRSNRLPRSLRQWDDTLHVLCQFASWLPQKLSHEDLSKMQILVHDQFSRLLRSLCDCNDISDVEITLHWFVIEASVRFQTASRNQAQHFAPCNNCVLDAIMQMVAFLFKDMQNMVQYVRKLQVHGDPISHRPAEIWISLFHLLEVYDIGLPKNSVHPLWLVVQKSLQSGQFIAQSGLEGSETMWRAIFSLCALSQFSIHGMSTSASRIGPSWQLVVQALSKIRLTDEPVTDTALSKRNLRKRDDYVRMVAARCLILVDRWRWNLDYSSDMFNGLAEIFRSRSFGNLRGEPSDFPAFMLQGNLELLFRHTPSDSAFELFVKLIVRTSHTSPQDMNLRKPPSAKSKKLLSLAVPVGSVSFTNSIIATNHELSMLYNRFTAIAVAIYLDPTPPNIRVRLEQARRYVIFKEALTNVRMVCIRAAMYFAILLRRCQVSCEPALDWFVDMTFMLVNENHGSEKSSTAHISAKKGQSSATVDDSCVQLLIASLRYLLEVAGVQTTRASLLSILGGPWISHVFTSNSPFISAVKVRSQLRRLLHAFLNVWETSGDDALGQSQLNDRDAPALRTGSVNCEFPVSMLESNKMLCEIIENHIIPTIYHIVGKFTNDDMSQHNLDDAGQWIDCWVRYANLLVQYQMQDWSQFLQFGPQSWEKIIDTSWRRWVGLRFMYRVLQADPGAYLKYQQTFMRIFLESLVTLKVTLEPEYMALMLNIDGSQHPLLENLLVTLPSLLKGSIPSVSQFLELRPTLIEVMFANLNRHLHDENDCDISLIGQNQVNLRLFVSMFGAMEDNCKSFTDSIESQYHSFCQFICNSFLKHADVVSQSVLAKWAVWAKAF